jgi:hypothetical protein
MAYTVEIINRKGSHFHVTVKANSVKAAKTEAQDMYADCVVAKAWPGRCRQQAWTK